jgi:hypothetical protein
MWVMPSLPTELFLTTSSFAALNIPRSFWYRDRKVPTAAAGVALSVCADVPLSRPFEVLRNDTAPVEGLRTIFKSAAAQAVAALSGALTAGAGTMKIIQKTIARAKLQPGAVIPNIGRFKFSRGLKSTCLNLIILHLPFWN